ncbi:MAG: hypothetical protein Q7U16_09835 [Agitococcus sp.]|nr:hypothetical protein [Agitococcus sp.]
MPRSPAAPLSLQTLLQGQWPDITKVAATMGALGLLSHHAGMRTSAIEQLWRASSDYSVQRLVAGVFTGRLTLFSVLTSTYAFSTENGDTSATYNPKVTHLETKKLG